MYNCNQTKIEDGTRKIPERNLVNIGPESDVLINRLDRSTYRMQQPRNRKRKRKRKLARLCDAERLQNETQPIFQGKAVEMSVLRDMALPLMRNPETNADSLFSNTINIKSTSDTLNENAFIVASDVNSSSLTEYFDMTSKPIQNAAFHFPTNSLQFQSQRVPDYESMQDALKKPNEPVRRRSTAIKRHRTRNKPLPSKITSNMTRFNNRTRKNKLHDQQMQNEFSAVKKNMVQDVSRLSTPNDINNVTNNTIISASCQPAALVESEPIARLISDCNDSNMSKNLTASTRSVPSKGTTSIGSTSSTAGTPIISFKSRPNAFKDFIHSNEFDSACRVLDILEEKRYKNWDAWNRSSFECAIKIMASTPRDIDLNGSMDSRVDLMNIIPCRRNLKDPLMMAIVDHSNAGGGMTHNKWKLLEVRMLRTFVSQCKMNLNIVPTYKANGWHHGCVKIVMCNDQKSVDFLKSAVSSVGEVWRGAKLEVVPRSELSNRPRAWACVPREPSCPEDIIFMIQTQNSHLLTQTWKLAKQEKARDNNQYISIELNWSSLKKLYANGWTINYGFNRVKLNLYKEYESLDIPSLSEPPCSAYIEEVEKLSGSSETDEPRRYQSTVRETVDDMVRPNGIEVPFPFTVKEEDSSANINNKERDAPLPDLRGTQFAEILQTLKEEDASDSEEHNAQEKGPLISYIADKTTRKVFSADLEDTKITLAHFSMGALMRLKKDPPCSSKRVNQRLVLGNVGLKEIDKRLSASESVNNTMPTGTISETNWRSNAGV